MQGQQTQAARRIEPSNAPPEKKQPLLRRVPTRKPRSAGEDHHRKPHSRAISEQSPRKSASPASSSHSPQPLIVDLKEDNFARLLMHDDAELFVEEKKQNAKPIKPKTKSANPPAKPSSPAVSKPQVKASSAAASRPQAKPSTPAASRPQAKPSSPAASRPQVKPSSAAASGPQAKPSSPTASRPQVKPPSTVEGRRQINRTKEHQGPGKADRPVGSQSINLEEINFAELLQGNLPDIPIPQKQFRRPAATKAKKAEKAKKTRKIKKVKRFRKSRNPGQIDMDSTIQMRTDRALSTFDSIFKPVRQITLSEKEDPYFDKEGKARVDYSVLHAAPITKFSLLIFFITVGIATLIGWHLREAELLIAESGLGYNLGIIGGSMMLVLIFYPMRKKCPMMKKAGPIKFWFHLHMIFGTLGPALVLYHANFGIGSLNSAVALTFTILVAASGFFHVFVHTKVHYHLHGKKLNLQEMQDKMDVNRSSLQHVFEHSPDLKEHLLKFENEVLSPPLSVMQSIYRVLSIGMRTRLNYKILTRGVKRTLEEVFDEAGWPKDELKWQHKSNQKLIKDHMKVILKIVELSFYERLFAQWYFFHGPLFYMLIFVGILHVIAVHMY